MQAVSKHNNALKPSSNENTNNASTVSTTTTSPNSWSPLAVVSRMISTSTASNHQNLSFTQQISFHILHTSLHIIYLLISCYQYLLAHYRRIKLKFMLLVYYHNRTPQLIRQDVSKFPKIPGHVATILQLKENEEGGGVEGLNDQTGNLAAWCIGAGIGILTIYEKAGTLKNVPVSELNLAVTRKLTTYYGDNVPLFKINAPGASDTGLTNGTTSRKEQDQEPILCINILSDEDGRETIVDLARTLAEMAREDKIRAKDLTIQTIDSELKQLVGQEPDLLILFGSFIDLQGYPPWHIRLSEIYHQPDNDDDVSYTVFYKALENYSGCKINVGR